MDSDCTHQHSSEKVPQLGKVTKSHKAIYWEIVFTSITHLQSYN